MSPLSIFAMSAALAGPSTIPADRDWDVLTPGDGRTMLADAGEKLGDWELELAGLPIDGPRLTRIARSEDPEILRALREDLGRPFDLTDLLLFIDDVLAHGERGQDIVVPTGRLRSAGVVIHPNEVFKGEVRRYGSKEVAVDRSPPQTSYEPAADGSILGPEWSARYRNPDDRETLLGLLSEANADFATRIESLLTQLEEQGAEVYVTSTVRSRHRGYLMWGAFELSRAESEAQLNARQDKLNRVNEEWGLFAPIVWQAPGGWEETKEAARKMADAYDVVYATEKGARSSNHYDGVAADIVVLDMPRSVRLVAPDGFQKSFDLSDPNETRDLSLTPQVIEWVEAHFGVRKLRSDYPHWDDAG